MGAWCVSQKDKLTSLLTRPPYSTHTRICIDTMLQWLLQPAQYSVGPDKLICRCKIRVLTLLRHCNTLLPAPGWGLPLETALTTLSQHPDTLLGGTCRILQICKGFIYYVTAFIPWYFSWPPSASSWSRNLCMIPKNILLDIDERTKIAAVDDDNEVFDVGLCDG